MIVWDLECVGFNFKGDKGFLLCVGYKYLGDKKTYVIERKFPSKDCFDDKELCQEISKVLSADGVEAYIGHNLNWFDVPFMNTRLLLNGLPPLPKVKVFDTCSVSYKLLRVGNSLGNLIQQFDLPAEKTRLSLPGSLRAAMGDKKEMALISDHCRKDVIATEELYKVLLPLEVAGWSRASLSRDMTACPRCAKTGGLLRRGWNIAIKKKAPRLQCKFCRGWSSGKAEAI